MPKPESLSLSERLRLWGETLTSLSEPDRSRRLVHVLNNGDRRALMELVGERLFEQGGCIDVVETLTRVVNFGPSTSEERCEVVQRLRQPNPSSVNSQLYRLNDGSYLSVTDADWWAYYDRASQDPGWLAQNRELLKALGIIACVTVVVPNDQLVSIDRSRSICFRDVARPWD
jgi:hypothetical protein